MGTAGYYVMRGGPARPWLAGSGGDAPGANLLYSPGASSFTVATSGKEGWLGRAAVRSMADSTGMRRAR